MKSESYAVFLRSVKAYSLPSGHIASSSVIKTSPSCFDLDQLLHCSSFSVYQSLPSVAFFLCIKLYMSVTFRFLLARYLITVELLIKNSHFICDQAILKSIDFDSSINFKWELVLVQLLHCSTDYFHYDTSNCRSHIRIQNETMRSHEQLNQLFDVVLPVNCCFDLSIESTTTIESKH